MFKVMLVDDEILALEYLKNMIDWEEQGFEITWEALNGRKAFELYQEVKVDIVISDIKMPVMDGIELTKDLKLMDSSVKIILISAYKDFDYAKSGIQYGVSNYLLKHELTKETLIKELNKVKESIQSEKQLLQSHKKYLIKNIIYSTTEQGFEDNTLPPAFGTRVIMILLSTNTTVLGQGMEDDALLKSSQRLNGLIESIREVKYEDLTYLSDLQISENHYIVLFGIEEMHSEFRVLKTVNKGIRIIFSIAEEMDFISLRLCASKEIHSCEIAKTFRKLAKAIHYSAFMDFGKGYFLDEPRIPIDTDNEPKLVLKGRIDSIIGQSPNDIKEHIRQLFDEVSQVSWRLKNYKLLLSTLNQCITKFDEHILHQFFSSEVKIKSFDDIVNSYVDIFMKIGGKNSLSNWNDYTSIIKEVIEYINHNYEERLTLDYLGELFELNGVYLGQLFKKEVGITFLKYLTNYRMEIAEYYLANTRLSIGEIADKIGYNSSQYFSQIFTKHIGLTPQEYKKWGCKNEKKTT